MTFMSRLLLTLFVSFIHVPLPLHAGKIYWTDRGASTIQRADFDGSNVETLYDGDDIPGASHNLRGIAVDPPNQLLYFCDNNTDTIYSAEMNPHGVITPLVTDLGFPADLTLDLQSRKMYWCDETRDRIQRAGLDGSAVEDVIETDAPYYLTLERGSGKVYWGDFSAGNIFRAAMADGSGRETLVSGINQTRAVQVDPKPNKLYWINRNDSKVQRRDIDGGAVEDLYVGLDTPHGMTIDSSAGKIYWVDTGTNSGSGQGEKTLSRGDMDGSGPMEILVDLKQPWDVVLDLSPGSFPNWQGRFFGADALGQAEPPGDPDDDAIVNTLEYALGLHPLRHDPEGLPEVVLMPDGQGNSFPALRFRRLQGEIPGLSYAVELSRDLVTWTDHVDGGALLSVTEIAPAIPHDDGTETATYRALSSTGDFSNLHMRLRVRIQ